MSQSDLRRGVTAAQGFRAAGVACGIRTNAPDLALIVSDRESAAAAVFTQNLVQAAPVVLSRQALRESGGFARAIVVNSGNANACTGLRGSEAAEQTSREAARLLGLPTNQVLLASTGVIGIQLPLSKLLAGLPSAAHALSATGGSAAAEAILTTDTRTKETSRRIETERGAYVIGGMAKGSGMIHPNMATTLAFVTTDASMTPAALQTALKSAVDHSFNRVTVDGDTSTNDMVAALANGASAVPVAGRDAEERFSLELTALLVELARAVARDGEGATRLITVTVTGADSEEDALRVARCVAGSPLVKTAVHGADANWGRIVAAAGRAGVQLVPERLTIRINDLPVMTPGFVADFSEEEAASRLSRDEVVLEIDLAAGNAEASVWTCDLSSEYIAINADYRT